MGAGGGHYLWNSRTFGAVCWKQWEWRNYHASAADAADSLRSPALRPSNFSLRENRSVNFEYAWGTPEQSQQVVEDLAGRRAEALRQQNVPLLAYPPGIEAGRLLINLPEESDHCCLSIDYSEGFVDDLDVLAWDTWVCYAEEINTPTAHDLDLWQAQNIHWPEYKRPAPPLRQYLLCWIPAVFTPLAEDGIAVNPVGCLFWASDYKKECFDTPLLRQLDAEGLLF